MLSFVAPVAWASQLITLFVLDRGGCADQSSRQAFGHQLDTVAVIAALPHALAAIAATAAGASVKWWDSTRCTASPGPATPPRGLPLTLSALFAGLTVLGVTAAALVEPCR